jgi:hypothetical protein
MTENEKKYALIDIAITKAYNYSQEYDHNSGHVKDKAGYLYLKQGFTDGFLAGVAFRLNGETNE